MRRIFAVLIIIVIMFWMAYGLVPPVKATVNHVVLEIAGPAAYSGLSAAYTTVISTIGVSGFAAMILGFGFVVGIVVHVLWVKADWRIRKWGQERTAKDLGVTPTADLRSTTPLGATTRPAVEEPSTPVVEEQPKPEGETS